MAIGLGRAKLAIPKVNQNPRPPQLKAALGSRMVARPGRPARALAPARGLQRPPKPGIAPSKALTPVISTAQVSNPAPSGSTSAAANIAGPAPTPPTTTPFAIPTWNPKTAGEPDPRDATYWTNLSKLQFQDQNEYAKDLQEQTTADAAYNSALQQAIQGRHVQERQLGESAIKGNLGSSGWLDRTQGEQVRDYTQERANAQLTKTQEDAARLAARNALTEGYGVEAAGLLAEAAARYAEGQAGEAENGAPESAPAGGEGGKGGGKSSGKSAGTFHFYSGPNQLPMNKSKPIKKALAHVMKAR